MLHLLWGCIFVDIEFRCCQILGAALKLGPSYAGSNAAAGVLLYPEAPDRGHASCSVVDVLPQM